MKRLMITALVLLTAVPVATAGGPSADATKNASTACTALKAKMGATAFSQAYSTYGKCVSSLAQVEQQNINSAQAACTAEQDDPAFATSHGGKTFAQFYGTGKTGSNAFGRCVSTKAQASSKAEQQGRQNPAQLCRAQRTQMGVSAFGQLYGKNANDRNAFGKCVSKLAHAQTQNELSAASACRDEQDDATFAVNHGGKTFAQTYGTGNLANAFGKCVSSKANDTTQAQHEATISAAKTCSAEQKTNATAFKTKYGTFGRCVSQHANP